MPLQPIANASDDHDGTDLRWNWMQNCRWAVWALARVLLANAAGRDAHGAWSFGRVRRPRGATYTQGRWPMGRRPGDACRDGDGREAEASLRKLGFRFVRA